MPSAPNPLQSLVDLASNLQTAEWQRCTSGTRRTRGGVVMAAAKIDDQVRQLVAASRLLCPVLAVSFSAAEVNARLDALRAAIKDFAHWDIKALFSDDSSDRLGDLERHLVEAKERVRDLADIVQAAVPPVNGRANGRAEKKEKISRDQKAETRERVMRFMREWDIQKKSGEKAIEIAASYVAEHELGVTAETLLRDCRNAGFTFRTTRKRTRVR